MSGQSWQLLPYQTRWVQDTSSVKVAVKSRRIGLSWAEAYDSVLHAAAGNGNIAYISYSKDMTAGFIADCADWAKTIAGIMQPAGMETKILEDEGKQILSYSITFPSGKSIEALSSAPRQLRSRGRPGDRIIIDEAGFVDKLDDLLQAAMAVRIWGGSLRIISTHNGALNSFNNLVNDIQAGDLNYSLHKIPFDAAIADGLFRRVQKVRKQAMLDADDHADTSDAEWTQEAQDKWVAESRAAYRYPWQAAEELDCIPSDGDGTWISAEDYAACEHPLAGLPEHAGDGVMFIGYDIARRRDLSVLSVLEKMGNQLWLRELRVMQNEKFAHQLNVLDELVRKYKPRRIVADQTGMGEGIVEQIQTKYGESRAIGEVLSSGRRLDIATFLRNAFEDHLIKVPRNNTLRNDIRAIRRAPGVTSDRPRLIAEGADTDGHADRFWSIALAVSAAVGGNMNYEFHRVRLHEKHTGQVHSRSVGIRNQTGGL